MVNAKCGLLVSQCFFCGGIKSAGTFAPCAALQPDRIFEDIHRVSKMLAFKAKDYSFDSFPGDHGLMLMIYAGFMLKYFGKKWLCRQLRYFNDFRPAADYGRSALVHRYCRRFFKYCFGWIELGFIDAVKR